jgi:hypothetical protein
MTNETDTPKDTSNKAIALLAPNNFELAQRMATALSKSSLIPKEFQENLPNCLIALEMSHRMGASPMMVMQNLYIVHGKPAWSSQFVIAAINSTGRFSPLRFQMEGEGDKRVCIAWAIDLAAGERLEGPPVSIDMAKKEGWFQKNGSKWQTMPELMLRYRAATFFGRLYAPEILMGMREEGEIIDVDPVQISPSIARPVDLPPSAVASTSETVSPNNGTPAAKKKRAKKDDAPPPNEAPVASPAADQVEAKLKEAGYKPEELIRVAIVNNWAEPTTQTIVGIGDEKLNFFIKNWPDVLAELQVQRDKKPTEKQPFE